MCVCVYGTGLELKILYLLGRSFITCAIPSPFSSGYFGDRVLILEKLSWATIHPFMLPLEALATTIDEMTVAGHTPSFLSLRWGHVNYLE